MAGYIKALKEQFNALAARLTAEGIDREGLAKLTARTMARKRAATGSDSDVLAPANFEHDIIDKLKGKPGGVSLIEVRASLKAQGKAKAQFDRAVLSLYKGGRVYLDLHDHPMRLSDAERRDLVFDGAKNYYVGITLRGDIE